MSIDIDKIRDQALWVTGIPIPRYTYDAWRSFYKNSSREEYQSLGCPDNLLDYLALVISTWEKEDRDKYSDYLLRSILVGDQYLRWLGDRESDEDAVSIYMDRPECSDEEITKELADAKLLDSYWVYAFLAYGMVGKSNMDGRLSKETTDALTNFLTGLIHNDRFSVYVVPYLMRWETACRESSRLISMAKQSFSGQKSIRQSRFNNITYPAKTFLYDMCVPFVIKERHIDGNFTVREVWDYRNTYRDANGNQTQTNIRDLTTFVLDGKHEPACCFPVTEAGLFLQNEIQDKRGNRQSFMPVCLSTTIQHTGHIDQLYQQTCKRYAQNIGILRI